MEASSHRRVGGGLWNNPRASQYSKETQGMLRLMMQESRLTNLQIKRVNECLKNGAALPLSTDPTLAASTSLIPTKSTQKGLSAKPQKRSAESCRSGNSYIRDQFHPGPIKDSEKEKKRLQNIFATGQEEPTASPSRKMPVCQNPEERDPYQEVVDEIEERRQFLDQMASLGKEKQYIGIINSEISQRIRKLEGLEKTRRIKKVVVIIEGTEMPVEQKTENIDLKETGEEKTPCH